MSVRGELEINERGFSVADTGFFEIFQNGTQNLIGAIVNDSTLVSMAAGQTQLLIASAGLVYLYDLTAGTLTQIPAANFSGPVSMVGYCDGFFLALIADSNEFAVSGVFDATDWVTNGTARVSVFPDNLLTMEVDHREVWFSSATRTVVYYDSGNIFPFDVVPGGFIEQGIVAANSMVRIDNTLIWLGRDERGAGVVWRAQGYTPARVSNHAIEFAFQGYDRMDDAVSYAFQDQGHSFYHIFFPTANKSWRYDTATNSWGEVGYWNEQKGDFDAHHSWVHMYVFGKHLVGYPGDNIIRQMHIPVEKNAVWTFADDDGNPIRRVRRSPHISNEQKRMFFERLQVYVEAGIGPIPHLGGAAVPTTYILQDSTGAFWQIGITDSGVLTSQPASFGSVVSPAVVFTDSGPGNTSWQLGVTPAGNITTISVPFLPAYQQMQTLITASGTLMAQVAVSVAGNLLVSLAGVISRGPQGMLRFSDDAGHTWSNELIRSAGKAGEYKKRMYWERLGSARDRIFELACSDPIGWRIVDAYLEAVPGNGN